MPLRDFPNDRVTLIKKDGRRLDDLPVSVQADKILTNDPKIPIEDGDWFERRRLAASPRGSRYWRLGACRHSTT